MSNLLGLLIMAHPFGLWSPFSLGAVALIAAAAFLVFQSLDGSGDSVLPGAVDTTTGQPTNTTLPGPTGPTDCPYSSLPSGRPGPEKFARDRQWNGLRGYAVLDLPRVARR